jgi:thermostable 8-oxoguanine DNA glycosylase
MSKEKKQIKLGDAIAGLTKALHIPHCPKCEKRRQILNEIQSLGLKETVHRLRKVGESNTNVTNKDVKEIIKKLEDCCN